MNQFAYLAYIWHLRGIFVSDTYLAVTYEVTVAVSCFLLGICKMIGKYDHLV